MWCTSCIIPNRWRVSDDESRKVASEGEGACSPRSKVRSHLPLRGKLGWMTPRVGVKTTLTNGNAPTRGSCSQARAPLFCLIFVPPGQTSNPSNHPVFVSSRASLIYLSCRRNIQLMQHMRHFRIPQPRCVILKRQMILVIDPKPPQAIRIRERS